MTVQWYSYAALLDRESSKAQPFQWVGQKYTQLDSLDQAGIPALARLFLTSTRIHQHHQYSAACFCYYPALYASQITVVSAIPGGQTHCSCYLIRSRRHVVLQIVRCIPGLLADTEIVMAPAFILNLCGIGAQKFLELCPKPCSRRSYIYPYLSTLR